MKVKSIAILALISFASTVNAQENATNLFSNSIIVPLENLDLQNGPPIINIIPNQSKSNFQKPTAIKQRVRLSTHFSDGLPIDSTHFIFSGQRGSEPNNYETSNHAYDSTYQSSIVDSFSTLYPLMSCKYNDDNLLIIQNSYNKLGARLGMKTQEYYNDNSKKKYQSIDYFEDGTGSVFEDSMFVKQEFSSTGKLTLSLRTQYLPNIIPGPLYNYSNSYYYFYDATDRLVSYEYKVHYLENNPAVDSSKSLMFRIYGNTTDTLALKDSIVQTSFSGSTITNTNYVYLYMYDNNGNLISTTTLKDGNNIIRESYEYDVSNNRVKQMKEAYNNGWTNSEKIEYSYIGDVVVLEIYYFWDNNSQWTESGKRAVELNNQGLIVTQKYYDEDEHLQSKELTEYTTYNNIAKYSSETYNTINGIDSLVASNVWNYYYDEFDDLGVSSNVNEDMNWMLYPNPFNNTINLKINEVIGNQKYELKIMEISGRILKTQQIKTATTVIPMQVYAPGIYFIILENKTKGISRSEKVIKY